MRGKFKITITIVLFSVFFVGLGSYLFQKEKVVLAAEIEDIFSKAISLDMEMRLNESGMFYSFGSQGMDYPSKDGCVTAVSEDGVAFIEKDSLYMEDELTKRFNIILQKGLIDEGYPLQVAALDSIFREKLQEKGYFLATGVRYTNNQIMEIVESNPANILNKSIPTTKHILAISGDISVQGFYTLPFSVVFDKSPIPFILLFIAWLIVITGFMVLTLRKKPVEEIAFVPVSDIRKPLDSDPLIQISEKNGIYFDPVKLILHYRDDKRITLAPQPATFLLSLLEAPDHFLTYKEIDQIFWPKQEDASDARSQAVRRLKKDLSPVPELQIDNLNRIGYQLLVLS